MADAQKAERYEYSSTNLDGNCGGGCRGRIGGGGSNHRADDDRIVDGLSEVDCPGVRGRRILIGVVIGPRGAKEAGKG